MSKQSAYEPLTHWERFNCYLLLPGDMVTDQFDEVDCFKCRERLTEIIIERENGKIKRNYSQS